MNKRGETLLEVLIALTLITVSSAAAASAIMSANQSLSLSRDYLIAQNLASEALEGVKNIRDTNWMKFPINKDDCWLNIDPDITEAVQCPNNKFSFTPEALKNDYKINIIDGKWKAEKNANSIDTNINDYALYLVDGKYTPTAHAGIPISFYRAIRVMNISDTNDSITFQSIVKWYEGTRPYKVIGTEILTNYEQ